MRGGYWVTPNTVIQAENLSSFSMACPVHGDNAILIFRFDDLDAAIRTLTQSGIRVLKGHEVYAL